MRKDYPVEQYRNPYKRTHVWQIWDVRINDEHSEYAATRGGILKVFHGDTIAELKAKIRLGDK